MFTKIEEEDIGSIWFQQNDATCHTAEATLDVLRFVFEDRIISRRADVLWPPLLRFDTVELLFVGVSETTDPFKDNIREAIGKI